MLFNQDSNLKTAYIRETQACAVDVLSGFSLGLPNLGFVSVSADPGVVGDEKRRERHRHRVRDLIFTYFLTILK